MFSKHNKDGDGISKSILVGHAILLLHLFLIAGIGFLVLFFSGIINYIGWILLIGLAVTGALVYRFYRHMKKEGKTVYEMMRPSLLKGKSVEVSVMGGLVSLKVGSSENLKQIEALPGKTTPLLEDSRPKEIDELAELVRLFENGLITREEYDQAKETLFHK